MTTEGGEGFLEGDRLRVVESLLDGQAKAGDGAVGATAAERLPPGLLWRGPEAVVEMTETRREGFRLDDTGRPLP